MRKVSIIFDLDGTLLDTLEDLAETGNDVLLKLGFSAHALDEYRQFVGDGMRMLVKRMLPLDAGDKVVDEGVRLFKEIYQERWQRNCCLYEGVGAMLAALENKSIPFSVLSNKPHAFTVQFCDRFFPEKPFAVVRGQQDGFPKKPHPDGALEIAAQMGTPPADVFFVGDSNVDMQTAINAGITAVGVSWGFRGVEELRESGVSGFLNKPYTTIELSKAVSAAMRM